MAEKKKEVRASGASEDKMEKIVSLCKRRGFIFPGSEIYGGLANTWDYGPLGVELKNNIKRLWWQTFVQLRDDMVGIDASILMSPRVWEASGHTASFADAKIDCLACKARIRADHLIEDTLNMKVEGKSLEEINKIIKEEKLKCPTCSSEKLTEARKFNLLFKTQIGSLEDAKSTVYLRGETAQAMFVNFKNVLNSSRKKIPFGIAQQGKAFRNEITPGNFIFRTLEFEQMEIEYFIREKDWEKSFDYWLEEARKWTTEILGLKKEKVRVREHAKEELSHYSKKTVDFEYDFPFGGFKELSGLAYRTDFDLTNHQKASGQDMSYFDEATKEKFIPHVIEPTFGVDRAILAVLVDSFDAVKGGRTTTTEAAKEEEYVLRFASRIAPIKAAILPLIKKEPLQNLAKEIYRDLKEEWMVQYDETGTVGRRYRRQDEIGTPFCITVDFDSLEDKAVTVRDRDSMKQERIKIAELIDYLQEKLI